MDTAGQVGTLKESALRPICTTVWTFLDWRRPSLQCQGGKTGGPAIHGAEISACRLSPRGYGGKRSESLYIAQRNP